LLGHIGFTEGSEVCPAAIGRDALTQSIGKDKWVSGLFPAVSTRDRFLSPVFRSQLWQKPR
jgi:hypothetical protein